MQAFVTALTRDHASPELITANVITHVENLAKQEVEAQQRALVQLYVLLQGSLTGRELPASAVDRIANALPRIVELLSSSTPRVRNNALAVLGGAAGVSKHLSGLTAEVAAPRVLQLLLDESAAWHAQRGMTQSASGEQQQQQQKQQSDDDDEMHETLLASAMDCVAKLVDDEAVAQRAVMEPTVLACVLSLVSGARDAVLQCRLADTLCSLGAQEWARPQLVVAGGVCAAAKLLAAQGSNASSSSSSAADGGDGGRGDGAVSSAAAQREVSVRCLLLLGMLLPESEEARAALAADGAAMTALLALLRQTEDADCRAIARDVLALLLRDAALRPAVEAAMRSSSSSSMMTGSSSEGMETHA